MSTLSEARDAILGLIATGWAASTVTQNLPLLWDDVEGDKPGHDVSGRPRAYGRATVRHFTAATESVGLGEGVGKEEHAGQVVVQVFTPRSDGRAAADLVSQVVKRFFQRQRIPGVDGWFTSARALEVSAQGPWDQTNVVAAFRYTETVTA